MKKLYKILLSSTLSLALFGCAQADDLATLNDEFDNAKTLAQWKRLYQVEGWPVDQLEKFDISQTTPGSMMMMPYSSVWYRDYRGVLAFKLVKGDFVMTTRAYISQRNGQGAPRSPFSLGGIMIRAPRDVTAQTRQPNGENYVFLSLGAADRAGTYQFEAKTTVNSESKLTIADANSAEALLQVARVGESVILLAKTPKGNWSVLQRYRRADLPETLQAGLTSYTDWPTCQRIPVEQHNTQIIREGNADLVAWFDYVHYQSPADDLKNRDLSNPAVISDAELLRFLGDNANSTVDPTAPK